MRSRKPKPESPLAAVREVYTEAKQTVAQQKLKDGDIPVLMFTGLKDRGWVVIRMSKAAQAAWLAKWKGK